MNITSDSNVIFHNFEVFPWHPSFDTGNELIDSQHKNLVFLLNKLANTLAEGNTTEINEAFDALADYANIHFRDEEEIWRKYFGEDSWFHAHHQTHVSFLPTVIQLRKVDDENTDLHETLEDVIKFLIRWLAVHILENDRRMSLVMSAVDAGSSLEDAKLEANEKMSGEMHELVEAVLSIYEGLSSKALEMIRERNARLKAEGHLEEAYEKLVTLSITDQLTGLFNRRHFYDVTKRELARAARSKERVAFYMLDVDFFKEYNDMYGHLIGDNALQKIARALQSVCQRPGDFVFRYGGEELCVFATDLSASDISVFGEKIRASVEALGIPHAANKDGRHLTISVGVVSWIPSDKDNLDNYISRADEALYKSKETGRNKVTCADKII